MLLFLKETIMNDDIKPITASEFKAQRSQSAVSIEKIRKFNSTMERAMTDPVDSDVLAHLHFEHFGYDYEDVAFVKEAGFSLARNSACLWWEVYLPK